MGKSHSVQSGGQVLGGCTITGSISAGIFGGQGTDDADFEGVEVWDQFVVEGASDEGADVAFRPLARLYRACGFDVEADTDYEVNALEGRDVLGRLVEYTFRGQPRSRVRAYRPLPRRKAEPAAEGKEGTPF